MSDGISDRTLAEMTEGARMNKVHAGDVTKITPEYMETIIRTQQRAAQIKAWEKSGHIRVEYAFRRNTGDKTEPLQSTIVHVKLKGGGETQFEDIEAQKNGAWPSEVLVANIALAIMANQGKEYVPGS